MLLVQRQHDEGQPSDWYLRLAGQGAGMLRAKRTIPPEIPIVLPGK